MTKLSQRMLTCVGRAYHQDCGLRMLPILTGGTPIPPARPMDLLNGLSSAPQTRAYGLQEALHGGEPHIFPWVPGLVSWAVAMVDDHEVQGGLVSTPVLSPGPASDDTRRELAELGLPQAQARAFLESAPIWAPDRIRAAAAFLHQTFYQISGWKPRLLDENRIKARQQRQIAEAIEEQRSRGQVAYPIDKERMLLSLIRAGDKNGARKMLNEMLGAMFLSSAKLPILRARAIELMGYLTRAAIEDSPLLEPLIERNHQWMQRLIDAPEFETLAHVLMRALDDFMEGIFAHGFNCHNPKVSRVLDYVAQHYTEPLGLRQVAEAMGIGTFRLSHLVKRHTGKTLLQHVMRLRINKAQQLLERSSRSCPEIALEVGFCDQSYFIKHFKRLTGTTPARYRRGRVEGG